MFRGSAPVVLVALLLGTGLTGCIESKNPLLPEDQAINRPISGIYTSLGVNGPDGVRALARWSVSQEGARYKIQGSRDPAGKVGTLIGTLHPFDDRYLLFQFREADAMEATNYSYWLVALRSNWILINAIECDGEKLRKVGARGTCRDVKSRRALTALAKLAARYSLDKPKDDILSSDFLSAALRIQD